MLREKNYNYFEYDNDDRYTLEAWHAPAGLRYTHVHISFFTNLGTRVSYVW